jgi:hypothetical protein
VRSAEVVVVSWPSRCQERVPAPLFGAALLAVRRTDWKRQRAPYELT